MIIIVPVSANDGRLLPDLLHPQACHQRHDRQRQLLPDQGPRLQLLCRHTTLGLLLQQLHAPGSQNCKFLSTLFYRVISTLMLNFIFLLAWLGFFCFLVFLPFCVSFLSFFLFFLVFSFFVPFFLSLFPSVCLFFLSLPFAIFSFSLPLSFRLFFLSFTVYFFLPFLSFLLSTSEHKVYRGYTTLWFSRFIQNFLWRE